MCCEFISEFDGSHQYRANCVEVKFDLTRSQVVDFLFYDAENFLMRLSDLFHFLASTFFAKALEIDLHLSLGGFYFAKAGSVCKLRGGKHPQVF